MRKRSMRAVYFVLEHVHRAVAAVLRGLWWVGDGLQARVRVPLKVCLGMVVLFTVACAAALWGVQALVSWMTESAMLDGVPAHTLGRLAGSGLLHQWSVFGGIVAATCLLGVAVVLVRRQWAWWTAVSVAAVFTCWWLWTGLLTRMIPNLLHRADGELYDTTARMDHWLTLGCIWLAASIVPATVAIGLFCNATRKHYSGRAPSRPGWADRLVHTLRTGGKDPRYSSSVNYAFLLFVLVLLGPVLLRSCGMEDPYGLTKGKGEPVVAVQKVQKKKKVKRKEYVVNPWSPYVFKQPELDDIEIIDQLEEVTADTYAAQTGKSGLGTGGPGKGGWPHGMMDGKIRFIRLEYDGGDWDQDMGQDADYNLLVRFHQLTHFKIADNTESLTIDRLRRFPKDRAPPFVFLTGKGEMNLSSIEIKTLRWYCLEEGGCLFIDNGGGTFHNAVTKSLRQIFPGKSLRTIANDDLIFRAPFVFPNGAPPLWHHAGYRAMGVRHNDRWVVFYHPGDLNDAWKAGHSGSPEFAEPAFRLGINVMYYTFNQYHRIHFE